MQQQTDEKINDLLKRYEVEQREFENHPLWRELGTTPKEFFSKVNDIVKRSGISQDEWQQKLTEAKQALSTRLKEKRGEYEKFNFNHFKGLRA